ncbi:MAG: CRISPR-associated helicase Cas3' [Saprospiraceae bacterium]|nr:CRISPR-associated helicase Cas3' [Saprospiraceae bacterium]
MKPLSIMLGEAMRVENGLLVNAEKYLAHIPKPGDPADKKAETLGEHLDLVLGHARKICELHGLDAVVERLTRQLVESLKFDDPSAAVEWALTFFVNTIAFHDFGKVNEHFQTKRMQNEDALFQGNFPEIFQPCSGHSDLGGYIFSVYHLEKIRLEVPSTDDQKKLSVLALLFCNTILLHHSPKLKQPQQRVTNSQFLRFRAQLGGYLQMYIGFPAVEVSEKYFQNIEGVLKMFAQKPTDFALFALLRLNFSLLTASDYMATWHYGHEMEMETEQHWGVFSEAKRAALIRAARTAKKYNALAYKFFESSNSLQHPTEPNGDNLNLLRTEMTVEVLRQLEDHRDQRLFYLEAPTGGGKTNLSMLAVAELMRANPELNKVFYVFPFTTLITQTHKSIKDTLLLSDDDIALLHSRAGFQTLSEVKETATGEEDEGEEAKEDGTYGDKKRDFLQNLFVLYPFTLLTHIRFFDILKSDRKDDIYLMHRLANSVVVLDELQSYPPKQWDKMLFLLNEYGQYFNIRFILMSATLPRLDKIEAVRRAAKRPLPPVTDLLPDPKRYFLNPNFQGRVTFRFDLLGASGKVPITLPELAATVLEKSRARAALPECEGRVFTMVEFIFKKSATEFRGEFEQLDKFFDEIFVLSGTILESRRREIIAFLKKHQRTENLKVLLITTQVVEAGVDIDMDLGFKNISLIDSDEQLAGRVNRNVNKKGCEVWLFKVNEPGILYKEDLRLDAMREMTLAERQAVLEEKDFGKLYDRVFVEIEKRNQSQLKENFQDDYLPLLQKLDFPAAHEKFKLIDQPTLSVFVPLALPLTIENEKGEQEGFFSENELQFLEKSKIWSRDDVEIDGTAVWQFYRKLCGNKEKPADFVASKIEQKTLQGILSKFTFSTFDSPKNRLGLRCFCDEMDCFENYFVLTRYEDLYKLESGLDESKLENADNFF